MCSWHLHFLLSTCVTSLRLRRRRTCIATCERKVPEGGVLRQLTRLAAEGMSPETLRQLMKRMAMLHLRLLSFRAGDIFQSVGDYDRCRAMRARLHNRHTFDG